MMTGARSRHARARGRHALRPTAPKRRSTRSRVGALSGLAVLLSAAGLWACEGRRQPSTIDSESHWLRACEEDRECGQFGCHCGLCSVVCDGDSTCDLGVGIPAMCQAPAIRDATCADMSASTPICIPDCSTGACDPTTLPQATGQGLPSVAPVPACPEVASTTGLPPVFLTTEVERYDGLATVTEVASEAVLLTASDLNATRFMLRTREEPPAFLTVGMQVRALVRSGGEESERFTLLVLRDEFDRLLLAYHEGADRLYREGLFASPETLGLTMELRMSCQSRPEDACFDNELHAQYEGILEADSRIVTDGSATEEVTIDGQPYTVTFRAHSIEGTRRHPDCHSPVTPIRYLSLSLRHIDS
ncbi:MAG: hypothetical protein OXU20_36035 [Myxococcales bacterium]|nr:hypothetical protein [Myxococcales bacterium]